VLLVVDLRTDVILGGAGPIEALVGIPIAFGRTTVDTVLECSLRELMDRAGLVLGREAVCIGLVASPANDRRHTALAHETSGNVVLELLPDGGELHAGKMLSSIRAYGTRIGQADDPAEAFLMSVNRVRQLTGFDRVLIYRFLPDGSGSVLAEDKDERLPSFLNHRFPASDIPRQARALYCVNPIRAIADVDYLPSPLVWGEGAERQLDMSQCLLRSVSPVHIRYLKNMGVGASMSVSLMTRDGLWGLIACHHQTPRRLTCETLELCRQIGGVLSQYIHAADEAGSLRDSAELAMARDGVMRTLTSSPSPRAGLEEASQHLIAAVNANGVALRFADGIFCFSHTPPKATIEALANWVLSDKADAIFATDNVSRDCPFGRKVAPYASGLLSVVLPLEEPLVVLWFRVEQIEEIEWAGNPHEAEQLSSRAGSLTPRRSFETWRETVRDRARPWSPADLLSAENLRPRLAFVFQQERIRELNGRLSASNERLSRLAMTDSLTGLANRRAFDERLRSEWDSARIPPRPFALVLLDVDRFKQFNDLYGHPAGDDCLVAIGNAIAERRRVQDLAARIGGEEFGLILPDTTLDGAKVVAERIRGRVQALAIPHTGSPEGVVTISVGVGAVAALRTGTFDDIISVADRALYRAKEAGRNRIDFEH